MSGNGPGPTSGNGAGPTSGPSGNGAGPTSGPLGNPAVPAGPSGNGGGPSSGPSGGSSGSSGPTLPPGITARTDVITKCSSLVQEFRDGKISKAVACTRIMSAIPDSFVEGGQGEQAAHAYFQILDKAEKELADAAARGGADRCRPRSPSPIDESNSKRQKVDDAMLPWVVEDYIIESSLSPELQKTRSQLLEFAKDPKYVLRTILNSTSHIAFPESEWLAIIKGNAVDLNKVITHQFSVSHERQHAESIGDGVQLLFGSSMPTKTVSTQSDWITAYSRAARAKEMVFPHRKTELEIYRQYIMDSLS
ncbi:hypothetical protein FB451DRAFT_1059881 [Mycena latifolia]|nr:hypothetical protein FB451DRAFT_1059881 [Mycena latifolia]